MLAGRAMKIPVAAGANSSAIGFSFARSDKINRLLWTAPEEFPKTGKRKLLGC